MEHQTFELGGFCLQHSQARLNILVQTTLDVPQGSNTISLDSVVKYWVQRARRLTFHVELEAPHLNQEQLMTLIEILANAEVLSLISPVSHLIGTDLVPIGPPRFMEPRPVRVLNEPLPHSFGPDFEH